MKQALVRLIQTENLINMSVFLCYLAIGIVIHTMNMLAYTDKTELYNKCLSLLSTLFVNLLESLCWPLVIGFYLYCIYDNWKNVQIKNKRR